MTGRYPVEAAHLSLASQGHGHEGRGKSQKASDRWVLPLHPDLHREQHSMNEAAFWRSRRIDPHLACLILYGIYNEHRRDVDRAVEIASKAITTHMQGVIRHADPEEKAGLRDEGRS